MSKRLDAQVAIVTGSGQGIGEAIAKVFAAEGAKVVVATRTAKTGQETVDDILAAGYDATLHQLDVGCSANVKALVEATVSTFGQLNIVVHNAAVYPVHIIDELPPEALDYTLDVNLKAGFVLTQQAVPHMRKAGGGRILFTSSVTGPRTAFPGIAHYAASKAGVNGFIRAAAIEYAKEGITVNGVEPGLILTPAMAALGDEEEQKLMERFIPMGSFGAPDDIANAMLFLASDEARYITGQTIVVDGGMILVENGAMMTETG